MNSRNQFLLIFGILAGIFSIAGVVFNWDFFMNNSRARFFVNLFGREGARLFYIVLGVVVILLSFGASTLGR
jgi:hypothetical protein